MRILSGLIGVVLLLCSCGPAADRVALRVQRVLLARTSAPDTRRVSVNVAGNHALITIDENEHGAFRIDWLDLAGYRTIGEDGVITSDGLSGVDRSVLARMARSLYR